MPESWKQPVARPLFTDSLILELVEAAANEEPRDHEFRLHFSGAGSCTRKTAYKVAGIEADDPMDPAGLWVTWLGTLIHEKLQEAIQRRYEDSQVEVRSVIPNLASGYVDAIVSIDGVLYAYELKTVGGFGFGKAIGLSNYKRESPEGPRRSAVVQGALNALALGCQHVVVGYIGMEAISVQRAEAVGLGQFDRILAEWHIPEDVWRPMAEAEVKRWEQIVKWVDDGQLPPRYCPDDDGEIKILDPEAKKAPWQCKYCSHRPRCLQDGPGRVPIEFKDAS